MDTQTASAKRAAAEQFVADLAAYEGNDVVFNP